MPLGMPLMLNNILLLLLLLEGMDDIYKSKSELSQQVRTHYYGSLSYFCTMIVSQDFMFILSRVEYNSLAKLHCVFCLA